MKKNDYWSLYIKSLPTTLEDEATYWLFEHGASGVQQDLSFSQDDGKYIPQIHQHEVMDLIVYFESPPHENLILDFSAAFPQAIVALEKQPYLDWQKEWKKSWNAFCLVENFWVVPSWKVDDFRQPNIKKIIIDPGMAFGTGTHATTQLASNLILKVSESKSFSRAVDVGTGSGILAILLDKLDWPSIGAYDNDEHAERVFVENLEKNKSRNVLWDAQWFAGKTYDFIVANIIDGVLLDLKPQFHKTLDVGGHMILTGILKERYDNFKNAMLKGWDLEILEVQEKDEWIGLHIRRKG